MKNHELNVNTMEKVSGGGSSFFVFWLPSASFRFGLPGLHALSFPGNSIPR